MALALRQLLPWRTLALATPHSPAEAASVLARNLGDGRAFRGERTSDLQFRIRRVMDYRNSFQPSIVVAFEPRGHGALVRVEMRLPTFIGAFAAVWMTGVTLGGVVGIVLAITTRRPAMLLTLVGPMFGTALIGGGFAFEANRAEALLREMFPPPPAPSHR